MPYIRKHKPYMRKHQTQFFEVIVLSMLPLLREQNDNKARTESVELSELREHNLW